MKSITAFLLAIIAGLLFALPYLYANSFLLTWVAFVPLLYALENKTLSQSYLLGLLFGISCYASACYWIQDFIQLVKGYGPLKSLIWGTMFWLYSAQLPALLCLLYQWIRRFRIIPELILFPMLAALLYGYFPMLFSVQIGESQSQFLLAIQGVDLLGVYGLDLIIVLCNMAIYHMLVAGAQTRPAIHFTIALVALMGWFGYGALSLQYWNTQIVQSDTIKVGVVQPNEQPRLGEPQLRPGYSLTHPLELALTKQLKTQGAELVIWPESRYNGYFDHDWVRLAYHRQLQALGIPIIFQDLEKKGDKTFNTAIILDPQGEHTGYYQKIKRIAFGEYLPLVGDVPLLRAWVEAFFGEFINEVAAGTQTNVFTTTRPNLRIVPLICYETTLPIFVAQAVANAQQANLIVAQSSNGWFGKTRQPYQHITSANLRAVENRLAMVHAVNNGPSTVTLPTGEQTFISDFHKTGGYLMAIPIGTEHQATWFNRCPNLFLYLCMGVVLLLGLKKLRLITN